MINYEVSSLLQLITLIHKTLIHKSGRASILACLTNLLMACSPPAPPANSESKAQQHPDHPLKSNLILKSYTVSMDADYPPYSFRDAQGDAIGFDVDMLRSIGEAEGFNVEFDPMPWQIVINTVAQGKHQIALGGIARGDVVEQKLTDKILLSNPYNYGQDAVAINQRSPQLDLAAVNGLDSLKNLRIATIVDTGYTLDIEKLEQGQTTTILKENTTFLAYKHLFNNTADVVLADRGVLEYLNKNNPQLPISIGGKGKYFDEPYGMVYVIDKHHPELQAKINQGIATLVANGTYNQIHQKWFGVSPTYIPGKVKIDKSSTK